MDLDTARKTIAQSLGLSMEKGNEMGYKIDLESFTSIFLCSVFKDSLIQVLQEIYDLSSDGNLSLSNKI